MSKEIVVTVSVVLHLRDETDSIPADFPVNGIAASFANWIATHIESNPVTAFSGGKGKIKVIKKRERVASRLRRST